MFSSVVEVDDQHEHDEQLVAIFEWIILLVCINVHSSLTAIQILFEPSNCKHTCRFKKHRQIHYKRLTKTNFINRRISAYFQFMHGINTDHTFKFMLPWRGVRVRKNCLHYAYRAGFFFITKEWALTSRHQLSPIRRAAADFNRNRTLSLSAVTVDIEDGQGNRLADGRGKAADVLKPPYCCGYAFCCCRRNLICTVSWLPEMYSLEMWRKVSRKPQHDDVAQSGSYQAIHG